MYGTVMIATLADGARPEDMVAATNLWLAERAPAAPGYVAEHLLVADDGRTVVAAVQFASQADYQRLADDPAQDEFYRKHFAPLVDGDPRWIDGHWQPIGG